MHIYTIGYGRRSIDDFIALLQQYGVDVLFDSRSLPYSRFQPNFRKKALAEHLNRAGIGYVYVGEALGGKRVDPRALVDGQIDLERLAALPDFQEAIDAAAEQAAGANRRERAAVIMCAELRPENCHRAWMLAPQMEARGFEVRHIDERGALKSQREVMEGSEHV